jgi:hypothetical protein
MATDRRSRQGIAFLVYQKPLPTVPFSASRDEIAPRWFAVTFRHGAAESFAAQQQPLRALEIRTNHAVLRPFLAILINIATSGPNCLTPGISLAFVDGE